MQYYMQLKTPMIVASPSKPALVINFLIDKFKELDIATQVGEWQHVRSYQITPNQNSFERKFFHQDLGYMEVKENDGNFNLSVSVLDVFRHATKGDNLELIKKLFKHLLNKNPNPNIGYYEDTEHNLTNAASQGNLKVIRFLVENGVDIHVEGEVNVIAALRSKHYEVVQYFLETDHRINLEVIFNSTKVNEEMISFVKKCHLYQTLRQEVVSSPQKKVKVKI